MSSRLNMIASGDRDGNRSGLVQPAQVYTSHEYRRPEPTHFGEGFIKPELASINTYTHNPEVVSL